MRLFSCAEGFQFGFPARDLRVYGRAAGKPDDLLEIQTMHMTEDDRLALRPRDAAKVLGISQRTLYELTRRGDLPCVKLKRAVIYPRTALLAWLERKSNEGGQP